MAWDPVVISVLEVDPDLARGLAPDEARVARRHAMARVRALATGDEPGAGTVDRREGDLGLLMLGGLVAREVSVAGATCGELIGPGDLLRPWDWDSEGSPVGPEQTWRALQPARVAVLDRRFALGVCRWPEIVGALIERATRRTDSLAIHSAISHLTGIDARLLTVLWQLADRWGRVERAGVVVPLPLTHQTLARLVGAQRPSVTTALSSLARRGLVSRHRAGAWTLHGQPGDDLSPRVHHPPVPLRLTPDGAGPDGAGAVPPVPVRAVTEAG